VSDLTPGPSYPEAMTDFVVARSTDLEWRAVESELVLLDLRKQQYLSLNKTGAELWPLIVEGVDRTRLVSEIIDRHHVEQALAERDVNALVTQLSDAGLLQTEENGAPAEAG
jgi:hypothetical protein